MTEKERGLSRRTILKRSSIMLGTIGVSSGVVGAAGSSREDRKENEKVGVAVAKGSVRPGDGSGMSKSERNDYIERMRKRYGNKAVKSIAREVDEVSTMQAQPTSIDGEYMRSWKETLKAKDAFGTVHCESDNLIQEYRTDVTNGNGGRHYFYHHWSSARSRDYIDFTGNIWNFYNSVDFKNSSLLKYKPSSDIKKNGQKVGFALGVTAAPGGVGGYAEASTSFYLNQDTVRPHPSRTSLSGSKFATQWIGDYEGTQGLNGLSLEERPKGQGRNFDYYFRLKGGRYKKIT